MDIYDRDGKPITREQWESKERLGSDDYRRVAYTEVDETCVSTVWLGLDHSFGNGPPLIFESMVFGGELDQEQKRYSTEAEAKAGHEALVAKVRESAS